MGGKRSVYFSDAALEYLKDAEVLSSRLVGILLRYREIVRRELPVLSRAEWCAICDANNGCDDLLLGDHPESVGSMLWANVHDSPGLGEKWGIDQARLVKRMQQWSYAQQVAAFEVVRCFWLHTDLPTDEALALSGVTFAEENA